MSKKTVGIWMYQNGSGKQIQSKIVSKLRERDIFSITGLNLADAKAYDGKIVCHDIVMNELDAFFSYNAGEQTSFQMYLYETLNESIPCVNNFRSFALTEDKFRTANRLKQAGIRTTDYKLCSSSDKEGLKQAMREWGGRLIYKPTDGWGGMGICKIEDERSLDMLIPFLDQTNLPHFYVERFVNYDMTDFRVDIVGGEYISCYGRRAPADSWKTNVTGGGTVFMREPDDALVEIAKRAANSTGLEIAGVDLIYDLDAEEYVVLEANGIPAFATPEQERQGLDFNDRKIDAVVDVIEQRIQEHYLEDTQNERQSIISAKDRFALS